ncbi:hypothetical protein VH441_06885 [Psychrobacter sp. HD31]|uniref:hypothetical protein n=1 Tax=Psychrobacter sp. HD31 TaxID=3112003 RepID=UPI003DA496C8
MKMFISIIAAIAVLGLSACSTGGTNHTENIGVKKIMPVNIPNSITYNGQTYRQKNLTPSFTEYYLANEKDFDWSKLITIHYAENRNFKQLDNILREKFKIENLPYAKTQLTDNSLAWQMVYPPLINDSRYNSIESNTAYALRNNCALVSVTYAENYQPTEEVSAQINAIAHSLDKQKTEFIIQAQQMLSKVKCK